MNGGLDRDWARIVVVRSPTLTSKSLKALTMPGTASPAKVISYVLGVVIDVINL